ncbi:thiol:disulfide interchange protein DsbA/DsbL [Caenimonas soli]|uniref:thiol:disulfide interchange protein DsbA/DsbL n=1 Tax=Caenimonas soli TaxID=2735555 RepID=UPI001555E63A|nr:thiol:disulfide interchange protein DsbA/DsbL [Caenimonas soli]NPC59175.1 thiol:disulfide interchange protein DsbA/DsbL [Caenimonas soli]
MNRRDFSAGAACVLATAALGLPGSLFAQIKKPDEGTEYLTLDKRVSSDAPQGKVEVIEFFWYSCPHCNAFEPRLEAWIKKQPADVVIKRVPVAFRDDFVPQQRLFYTLEAMGKLDELHGKVFQAIHANREPINREDLILAWAGKQGLDTAKFKELYNSFSVSSKARRAIQLQEAFQVQGVPAIGIAGRYYTDGTLAGNMDRALQVTDYLIAEARKTR